MEDNDIDFPTDSDQMCCERGFFDKLTEEQAKMLYFELKNYI
jgi:hypothetical protein